MRSEPTVVEKKLWQALRAGRCNSLKVRRQMPLGPFIADFVVASAKLVIEIDGGQHDSDRQYDARRTRWLQDEGYRVIRFWNAEVLGELDAVLRTILVEARSPLSPLAQGRDSTLSPEGRG